VRVCLVTLDFPPYRSSGLTIYAERLAASLTSRGHLVTILASGHNGSPTVERRGPLISWGSLAPGAELTDVESVVRVPASRANWIGLGWRAAQYLASRQSGFDVIHFADVHFAYAFDGPFVASAFQSFRQRLSSQGGRVYHTNRRSYAMRWVYYQVARAVMERRAVRHAGFILASSVATQREFVDNYGVAARRIGVVYPGIDLRRFGALPAQAEARRRLGLPVDRPVLLYVGFSTPRKGLEYLAEALNLSRTPANLVIVGTWEAGYRERFMERLGEARSAVRLAGYVLDAELPSYYAAADVFVLPTLLEGFGIPLVEAMAAGVPIVTTTAGSAAEVAGEAGLAVPPADGRALASAIDRVLADPHLAERLAQAGRDRAHALFDERRMAAEIEAVYLASGTSSAG
jgi:glycosyltransferase involved in cell wall biosynthesis